MYWSSIAMVLFSGLKEHTFIISQFLWVMSLGHDSVGSSSSGSHLKAVIKVLIFARVSSKDSTSNLKLLTIGLLD